MTLQPKEGTRRPAEHGDKQDAAGHQSPTTTGRYDHDLPVVKLPRRRQFFRPFFSKLLSGTYGMI